MRAFAEIGWGGGCAEATIFSRLVGGPAIGCLRPRPAGTQRRTGSCGTARGEGCPGASWAARSCWTQRRPRAAWAARPEGRARPCRTSRAEGRLGPSWASGTAGTSRSSRGKGRQRRARPGRSSWPGGTTWRKRRPRGDWTSRCNGSDEFGQFPRR